MDLFKYKSHDITCHSGGAPGSDTIWELFCLMYEMKVKAYSHKTKSHKSTNKVEISEEDFIEGIDRVKKANKVLGRKNIDKYMDLLARNWAQVKYSEEIFAIGNIVKEGDTSKSGYTVNCKSPSVDGGTGYAVQMAILAGKTVYVFDLKKQAWYKWSYIIDDFIKMSCTPKIQTKNFAGIGTREIDETRKSAIESVLLETFKSSKNI